MVQSTASATPSSIAAAARQIIPAPVAPPKSTNSPKLTGMPRYSAIVAGANFDDSSIAFVAMPSTSAALTPASSSAMRDRSAHCSRVKRAGPDGRRSGFSSARPLIAASPRRPILRLTIALGQSDGRIARNDDLARGLFFSNFDLHQGLPLFLSFADNGTDKPEFIARIRSGPVLHRDPHQPP